MHLEDLSHIFTFISIWVLCYLLYLQETINFKNRRFIVAFLGCFLRKNTVINFELDRKMKGEEIIPLSLNCNIKKMQPYIVVLYNTHIVFLVKEDLDVRMFISKIECHDENISIHNMLYPSKTLRRLEKVTLKYISPLMEKEGEEK